MRRGYLKFASKHIEAIKRGEKRVTVRVGFSSVYPRGKRMSFLDPAGEEFGTARLQMVDTTTPEEFVRAEIEEHRQYENEEELLEELRGYYPDQEIASGMELRVIRFKFEGEQ